MAKKLTEPLAKSVRDGLDEMRISHRVSFDEIARIAKVSGPTAAAAIRHGKPIRDYLAVVFVELLKQYRAGVLKFEDGKAVEHPGNNLKFEQVQP